MGAYLRGLFEGEQIREFTVPLCTSLMFLLYEQLESQSYLKMEYHCMMRILTCGKIYLRISFNVITMKFRQS